MSVSDEDMWNGETKFALPSCDRSTGRKPRVQLASRILKRCLERSTMVTIRSVTIGCVYVIGSQFTAAACIACIVGLSLFAADWGRIYGVWLATILMSILACSVFRSRSAHALRWAPSPTEVGAGVESEISVDVRAKLLAEEATYSAALEGDNRLDERIRILTAISHDVQTPITRMRLRIELADVFPEQEKLLLDLREAEELIRNGIAFAKSSHLCEEMAMPVDLRAFIESLVFDYQDTGRAVSIIRTVDGVAMLKPIALRRILSNFIDNAVKYAGSAEISICRSQTGSIVICVLDDGPGIACEQLESVMQPFVRLERDQFSGISGTGLGLAIANQLAQEMDARLQLANRSGGGLSARIEFGLKTVFDTDSRCRMLHSVCDVSRSA